MKKPLFSVIIPTFNRAEKLSICLNSVLKQTFTDYEIVIINNGSTDNTENLILNKYNDSRINYFWQLGSGSPAKPRNQGILKSKGIWVAFLDSDDLWYPEKLESVYEQIKAQPDTDIICHNERMCDRVNNKFHKISNVRVAKDMYKSMLMEGNCLSPSATTVKKSFLIEKELCFNESPDFAIVEDYDLWLHLAKNGAMIKFIDKILGDYVVDGGNMISDWNRFIINLENLYKDHAYAVQDFEPQKDLIYNRLIANIHLHKLNKALKEKKYFEIIKEFLETLSKSPTLLPKKIISKAILAINPVRY